MCAAYSVRRRVNATLKGHYHVPCYIPWTLGQFVRVPHCHWILVQLALNDTFLRREKFLGSLPRGLLGQISKHRAAQARG